jgi:hypothetical protein
MTRIVLALLVGLAAACSGSGTADGGKLAWQKDPKKGMELARLTGKPMLLYFTSDG